MKKIKSWQTILLISVIVLISSVFVCISLDDLTKCRIIYGKNICNFYAMMDIANHNSSISNFDEMMNLCKDMTDVPKKDGCFEYVARTFTRIDINKAKEACDEIKGFDGVYGKEDCYSRIYLQSTKIEPTKEMVENIVLYRNGKQEIKQKNEVMDKSWIDDVNGQCVAILCCEECLKAFSRSPIGVGPKAAMCGKFSSGYNMSKECLEYFKEHHSSVAKCESLLEIQSETQNVIIDYNMGGVTKVHIENNKIDCTYSKLREGEMGGTFIGEYAQFEEAAQISEEEIKAFLM